MSPHRSLTFKIDVDTYQGLRDGVPRLLNLFDEMDIKASFFIAYGPDHSGKAIWNCLKNPKFLIKMLKTRAWKLYGFKAMVSGTILPAPVPSSELKDRLFEIRDRGHEVGLHGWDHRKWQDHLPSLSEESLREELKLAWDRHKDVFKEQAKGFAAPGWVLDLRSVGALIDLGVLYSSSTRGGVPFLIQGTDDKTLLEIPSTLNCPEERMGWGKWDNLFEPLDEGSLIQVYPAHAEVEGGVLFEGFSRWITEAIGRVDRVQRVDQLAEDLLKQRDSLPVGSLKWLDLPGRASRVASQDTL